MALKHVYFAGRDQVRFSWARHRFAFIPSGVPDDFDFARLEHMVVLKLDGKLGDTQAMTHFYANVQRHCPNLHLSVVCPDNLVPVYRDVLHFDTVLPSSRKPKAAEIKSICARLTSSAPPVDLVVSTEGCYRPRDFIFNYELKPRFVAGCDARLQGKEINLFLFDPDSDRRHITQCFCDFMARGHLAYEPVSYVPLYTPEILGAVQTSLGLAPNARMEQDADADAEAAAPLLQKQQPRSAPLIVGINPCGAPQARRFSVPMVVSLIVAVQRYWLEHHLQAQHQLKILLMCPDSLRDFQQAVQQQLQGVIATAAAGTEAGTGDDAAGMTGLRLEGVEPPELMFLPSSCSVEEYAAHIACLAALVTVDTAAVHLACASHIPQLCFYLGDANSFEDKRWAPVGARAQVVRPQTERLDQMEQKTFVAMSMQFLQQVLPQ
ncbi:MAG: hypothetical protein H9847_04790 [Candidatus Anaerobiospirillum pullicola]|uniref:ADP-heptose:LPS heptosyltransferase n=1 Tax=Candidatus Anaerobiospirillum pullicola TaxID=2838451 RepID=A0A948TGE4_9GAMM|nr:hypothetical protein [Candidatus Anaerobiospirillum pullicola]